MNQDLLDSYVSLTDENRSSRTPRITHKKYVFKNDAHEDSHPTSLDSTVMMQGSPRHLGTNDNRATSSKKHGSIAATDAVAGGVPFSI